MRDSLSCSVELRRFGVWRWSIGIVALVAAASAAAWIASSTDTASLFARVAAATVASLLVLGALSLWRVQPGELSLRGGQWRFACFENGSTPEEGELTVALDLGSFLLLTLRSRLASGRTTLRWLPVQRSGLETGWHSLRCAAYAPQRPRERP